MDDLDDLLGEFGINTDKTEEEEEEKKGDDGDDADAAGGGGGETSNSKKKKKKKKKGGNNKSNNNNSEAAGDDWVQVDAPNSTEDDNVSPVDVAAVLKAKAKTKSKSAAEIAASTAAKEAKAKAAKQGECVSYYFLTGSNTTTLSTMSFVELTLTFMSSSVVR